MSLVTSCSIGLRYITSKRSNGFLSFVSAFAIGGMALGVFALIVVLSVMNGFDHELKQRILRAVPHGFISQNGGIANWKDLETKVLRNNQAVAASPFIGGNVLLSANGAVKGAQLQGVLPDQEHQVSPVANFFIRGEIESLKEGEFGIAIGSILAYGMGVQPGDSIIVTLPKVSITLAGVFPRSRKFKVIGIFEVGAQVDQQLAIIHIADAGKLFRSGDKVDGLRVKFNDLYAAPTGMKEIRSSLDGDYKTVDWSQTQGSLFRAVKLEKTVTGLLLSIVIAVAAFNIITSLVMMVTEKKSDIAVLRTMGMTRTSVMLIFFTQGSVSALIGIFLGLLFGVPAAIYFPELVVFLENTLGFQAFDPSVYFLSQIPSQWSLSNTITICIFACLVSFLATLYPAYRATLIEPAEAMRYDS